MDPLLVVGGVVLTIMAIYFIFLRFFSKRIIELTEAVVAVQAGGFSEEPVTMTDDPVQPGKLFGAFSSANARLIFDEFGGRQIVRVTMHNRHGGIVATYNNDRFTDGTNDVPRSKLRGIWC